MEKNKMSGGCVTYGGDEKYVGVKVVWGNPKGLKHLEDVGVNGRILKWIVKD
jgi:hypothetical protein